MGIRMFNINDELAELEAKLEKYPPTAEINAMRAQLNPFGLSMTKESDLRRWYGEQCTVFGGSYHPQGKPEGEQS